MKNLLTLDHVTNAPISDGDAGVILRADGTFQLFSTGDMNGGNLTEEQMQIGRKLSALALALSLPSVMNVLYTMLDDPAITGAPGIDLGRLSS